MTEDDKVRENRIRRIAERRGFRLEKSRRRDPRAVGFGGFMLCEAYRNVCVLGAHQFAYSATLDDVEKYLDEGHTGMFPREDKAKAAATKGRAKGKAR